MANGMSASQLVNTKYRADIDGLRAVAVLSVVVFHAFPFKFPGGYLGVDIFFVISGYLISTVLYENLAEGSFRFLDFYARRVKRIFPTLLLVLSICFASGWFYLLSDEFQQLGKHIAAGAGFISNLILWQESGYFDNAAATKPLLHLWSLGIEEQYYIFWPMILFFIWRQKLNPLAVMACMTLVSFGLNIWQISGNPISTFYSPQTRFWELLIGSLLAYLTVFKKELLQKYKLGNDSFQSLVGFLLLIVGLLFVNEKREFPGWWALLPTAGAALLISAGPSAVVNRYLLTNRLMVWIGLISFPLYLWHWPLLSFARIHAVGPPSAGIRIFLILLSIALAFLTWKFIEKPIRFGRGGLRKPLSLLVAMVVIGCIGYATFLAKGFGGYGPRGIHKSEFSAYFENSIPQWNYFSKINYEETYRNDCNFYDIRKYRDGRASLVPVSQIAPSCYEKHAGHKVVFIWGDSHAQQLYFGLKSNLTANWDVLMVASSNCVAKIESFDSNMEFCQRSNWFALQKIRSIKPDVVIIGQAHDHNFEEMQKVGLAVKNAGVEKVIFTGPVPHWTSDLPKIVVRRLWEDTPERTLIGSDKQTFVANGLLQSSFEKQSKLLYANLINPFCNDAGCLIRIGEDKKKDITSWDYGHLTSRASDYLARNLLIKMILP
jgi:peptidoglycan/LPS O-acetylase OafA/YrhL